MIDQETLIRFFKSSYYRPLRRTELAKQFKIAKSHRKSFFHLLKKLVQEGVVVRIKSNRYALPAQVDLVFGKLEANAKGFGFVIPDNVTSPDVFIAPHHLHTALHGDKVRVQLLTKPFRKNTEPENSKVYATDWHAKTYT